MGDKKRSLRVLGNDLFIPFVPPTVKFMFSVWGFDDLALRMLSLVQRVWPSGSRSIFFSWVSSNKAIIAKT